MTKRPLIHSPNPSRDDWGTPDDLFAELHDEFNFTIDLAADATNALLPRYYTKEQDALKQAWYGERAFCNPPYDQKSLEAFTRKALRLWGATAGVDPLLGLGVFLLPAKTDQVWWHNSVWEPFLLGIQGHNYKVNIRWIRGRVKYKGAKHGAGFPSVIVIYGG